jgi:carboxylate-amine ligase
VEGLSRTVGIEEELFLVDPETRRSAPRSQQVLKYAAEHLPGWEPGDLGRELFRHQVETRTPPLRSMEELREELVRGRRLAAEAAGATGLATMASGTVPVASSGPPVTTDDERYLDMVDTFGEIARLAGTCGMHVHVNVESPDLGVQAIDRAVPWLPVVLALSANSPFYQGHDTSYASWRSPLWAQWPSAGPTEQFGSLEAYREVGRQLRRSGAAKDDGMLYFDARLAADYPTVEFRISDVCTDPEDGVLIAALLRALVSKSVAGAGAEGARSASYVWRAELLRAAQWRAARYGVAERLLDPTSGELVKASSVLERFVAEVRDHLEETGDLDLVQDGIGRVLAGGGASRQRAAHDRSRGLEGVVDDLVERTNDGWRAWR